MQLTPEQQALLDGSKGETMAKIVGVHFPTLKADLLAAALKNFYAVRNLPGLKKKPSTSELIDWINALMIGGISADRIRQELPFVGVIVKKDEDLETVRSNVH